MRYLILTLFIVAFIYSCVKAPSKDPVPTISYKELKDLGKNQRSNSDTATLVLGYEDGDGNLFADNSNDPPNLIITYSYFNNDSNKFVNYISEAQKVYQPDKGSYKGKSIRGEITYPLGGFRPNPKVKIIKLSAFMVDKSNNKSNVVTSPNYTLNF